MPEPAGNTHCLGIYIFKSAQKSAELSTVPTDRAILCLLISEVASSKACLNVEFDDLPFAKRSYGKSAC